ncbi:hypothetical protein [Mesorhizobium sp. J428]|uniref:hypothetical protein n=1 Tax=Mesorhizobium sp. J428 TaxID=2898440 RepID=UPI0021518932|nr:hypothetical protein [Mesorhizobium sp. J428]MCR5860466.1 hypothetical protein [Mesorhizobium sp. J428]
MAVIDAEGVIGHRHALFKCLYTLRRESGLPNDRLIHDLHGRRHLIAADLVPLIVLIPLDTGLEIEAIKSLRADCLKNPSGGYVEVEYCKRRARGAEWKPAARARRRLLDAGRFDPQGAAMDRSGEKPAWRRHALGPLRLGPIDPASYQHEGARGFMDRPKRHPR